MRVLREKTHLLAKTMAQVMQVQNQQRGESHDEDNNWKIDMVDFDSYIDLEVYLEWERSMEKYIDFKGTLHTPDDKKV